MQKIAESGRPWTHNIPAIVLLVCVVAVPLIVVPRGLDSFRWPKEIAFRGFAILLMVGWSLRRIDAQNRDRLASKLKSPDVALPMLIVLWTALTTFTAVNRLWAIEALVTVIASVVIWFSARAVLARFGLIGVDAAMIPAVLNAGLVSLQEFGVWNPFQMPAEAQGHQASTALIGNPNDVGVFLLFPAVAAAVIVVTQRGLRQLIYIPISALLVLGLVASGTRAAVVAFLASFFAMGLVQGTRSRIAVLAVSLVVGAVTLFVMRDRFLPLIDAARSKQYNVVFSERLPAFLTAFEMLRSHPAMGVGPGGFKYQYMPYRLQLQDRYPPSWVSGWPMNFGEVHNDHLQVAAETGVIGLGLFLAAIGVLLRKGRSLHSDPSAKFSSVLAVALATATTLVCVLQFPLQLAAPRLMLLFLAAGTEIGRLPHDE